MVLLKGQENKPHESKRGMSLDRLAARSGGRSGVKVAPVASDIKRSEIELRLASAKIDSAKGAVGIVSSS